MAKLTPEFELNFEKLDDGLVGISFYKQNDMHRRIETLFGNGVKGRIIAYLLREPEGEYTWMKIASGAQSSPSRTRQVCKELVNCNILSSRTHDGTVYFTLNRAKEWMDMMRS